MKKSSAVLLTFLTFVGALCLSARSFFVEAGMGDYTNSEWDYLELEKGDETYQDAWKFCQKNVSLHLMYRTYKEDFIFDGGARCVRANSTFMNKKAKTIVVAIDYWDSYKATRLQNLGHLHFTRTKGYNVSNVLDSRLGLNAVTRGLPFVIAFTDYKTCAVVRFPGAKDGCQVWMFADSLASSDTSPCNFVCSVLCGKDRFKVYDTDLCAAVATKPYFDHTKDEL